METAKFGLAVIGSGQIARKVLKEIHEDCSSITVYSRNQEKAEQLCSRYGGRNLPNYEDVLKEDKVEGIYIATPHTTHYQFIVQALSAGKPVISEKPIVMNGKQLNNVISLSREKNVYFTEIMWFRHSQLFETLKNIVDNRALGDIVTIQADIGFDAYVLPRRKRLLDYNAGGGALLDIGIYMLSILEFLFGSEICKSNIEVDTEFSEQKVDINDKITVNINGVTCDLECSLKKLLPTNFVINFTKGKVTIPSFFRPSKMIVEDTVKNTLEEIVEPFTYRTQFINNFNDIKNGKNESPENSHLSITNTMFLMDEIRRKSGIIYDSSLEAF